MFFWSKENAFSQSIEVREYKPEIFRRVLHHGYVQNLVFGENLQGLKFDGSYFQIILASDLDKIKNFSEKSILRISDRELSRLDFENLRFIQFIELSVTHVRTSQKLFDRLNRLKKFSLILRSGASSSLEVFNQVLQGLQMKLYENLQFIKNTYDLPYDGYEDWISLENFTEPLYEQGAKGNTKVSVIIPHYESQYFLCNVIWHIASSDEADKIDVLVVDDGSSPKALAYIQYYVQKNMPQLKFRLFSWPDKPTLPNGKKIFRAGASRNWGAHYARNENLLFLDADMLVPSHIVSILQKSLKENDIVQFERRHIPVSLSHESADYYELIDDARIYIEEEKYWGQLFRAVDWMKLENHWKYVCTYALAMKKSTFNEVGRIRRNYIQYGFEDTDLGYRLAQKNLKFKLEKTPLLHLTSKEQDAQGWLFKFHKLSRIRDMARVFFCLNQDPMIYQTLRSLLF